MATVALPSLCRTPTPPPATLPEQSTIGSSDRTSSSFAVQFSESVTIPIKHSSTSHPGPQSQTPPVTPPASPPLERSSGCMPSRLYPADEFELIHESPPVRALDAATVAAALHHTATQPLPSPEDVFPWAHGLHPDNHIQMSFFYARTKSVRWVPTCLRCITVVKAGGDLNSSKLKGAVSADDVLSADGPGFINLDPRDGFCVRNFQIQVGKFATVSDIVVYGEDSTSREEIDEVAKRLSAAQLHFRSLARGDFPIYNTFVVQDLFSVFEQLFPELVAIDCHGRLTGKVVDFYHWERSEMCMMSRASEISKNVYLGSTADAGLDPNHLPGQTPNYSLFIEASDLAHVPGPTTLRRISEAFERFSETQLLEFPSSGSLFAYSCETDVIVETCRWIYNIANGDEPERMGADADGDLQMSSSSSGGRKVLIHCSDGYTETSLLALAYIVYAEGLPVHDAWLYLHNEKKRNFFAYAADLTLLRGLQQRLLHASPKYMGREERLAISEPVWLSRMDGSLPSRVLPYMYLGNLTHANNPALLYAMGIRRVLSVGELTSWSNDEQLEWAKIQKLQVENVQDNGVDSLSDWFRTCLEFIGEGRQNEEPTLVHCRVGVSRSATICIAEVMRSLGLSLPRAYCFVRARRLNVIIQPHCKFMYELLKWEEIQPNKQNVTIKREMEWATVAREIAAMNRPYSSR